MKARLVNGKLVKVANHIRLDNGDMIANPTEAILTDLCYKEVVDTPMPEGEEGYYTTSPLALPKLPKCDYISTDTKVNPSNVTKQ